MPNDIHHNNALKHADINAQKGGLGRVNGEANQNPYTDPAYGYSLVSLF